MSREILDGIEYIGINKEYDKAFGRYGEFLKCENFILEKIDKAVEEILSVAVEVKINDFYIKKTKNRVSSSGEKEYGKRAIADIVIAVKIKYIGTDSSIYRKVFFIETFTKLELRDKIEGVDIESLKRQKKICVKVYIEDIYIEKISEVYLSVKISGCMLLHKFIE